MPRIVVPSDTMILEELVFSATELEVFFTIDTSLEIFDEFRWTCKTTFSRQEVKQEVKQILTTPHFAF